MNKCVAVIESCKTEKQFEAAMNYFVLWCNKKFQTCKNAAFFGGDFSPIEKQVNLARKALTNKAKTFGTDYIIQAHELALKLGI